MGQTSSHKHGRSEMIKGANFSPTNSATHPQSTSYEYMYPNEDIAEDEEISCPTIGSKSPSEHMPIFKFPSRSDQSSSMSMRSDSSLSKRIPVVFKYQVKSAKEVYLIGTFTSWKEKILMVKSDGDFVTIVDLPEGEHQYKFVIDGKWDHDPNQPTVDDNFNGRNNIVVVKKSDFEVMDALAMDSIQQAAQRPFPNVDDLSRSPPGEYTDEMPNRGVTTLAVDKPPYLPPQLLNIVLNKDTSVRCEPALLPEPNHVMLKHLYALSIRDGVMVLSSTFRFKKKFITTCFYKPI